MIQPSKYINAYKHMLHPVIILLTQSWCVRSCLRQIANATDQTKQWKISLLQIVKSILSLQIDSYVNYWDNYNVSIWLMVVERYYYIEWSVRMKSSSEICQVVFQTNCKCNWPKTGGVIFLILVLYTKLSSSHLNQYKYY